MIGKLSTKRNASIFLVSNIHSYKWKMDCRDWKLANNIRLPLHYLLSQLRDSVVSTFMFSEIRQWERRNKLWQTYFASELEICTFISLFARKSSREMQECIELRNARTIAYILFKLIISYIIYYLWHLSLN